MVNIFFYFSHKHNVFDYNSNITTQIIVQDHETPFTVYNISEKFTKQMKNIIIFIEPNDQSFITSEKIAYLYMNRFFIDEDAGFELLGVSDLLKSSDRIGFMQHKGMNIPKLKIVLLVTVFRSWRFRIM